MEHRSGKLVRFPAAEAGSPSDALTEVLRRGARQMLAEAIEAEVADYLEYREHLLDEVGHRVVVRNGHLPARQLQTPLGEIEVHQPRVRDRRPAAERETFQSSILPPYLRKTRALEELLGPEAPGLSATTMTRLKSCWEEEYKAWQGRSLAAKRYVYVWADGVYFNVRLESPGNARQCILVLMGATAEGKKELLAVADGYRESEQSWLELLLDLRSRGLLDDPELATGDGALGFWKALPKVYPKTRRQRCWVHKTANVLNKMPKRSE